jgi:hypothetical protein
MAAAQRCGSRLAMEGGDRSGSNTEMNQRIARDYAECCRSEDSQTRAAIRDAGQGRWQADPVTRFAECIAGSLARTRLQAPHRRNRQRIRPAGLPSPFTPAGKVSALVVRDRRTEAVE